MKRSKNQTKNVFGISLFAVASLISVNVWAYCDKASDYYGAYCMATPVPSAVPEAQASPSPDPQIPSGVGPYWDCQAEKLYIPDLQPVIDQYCKHQNANCDVDCEQLVRDMHPSGCMGGGYYENTNYGPGAPIAGIYCPLENYSESYVSWASWQLLADQVGYAMPDDCMNLRNVDVDVAEVTGSCPLNPEIYLY